MQGPCYVCVHAVFIETSCVGSLNHSRCKSVMCVALTCAPCVFSDLIHCTNEMNVNVPQLADSLFERTTNSSWVVVFKALITTHHLMMYGNEVRDSALVLNTFFFFLLMCPISSSAWHLSALLPLKIKLGQIDPTWQITPQVCDRACVRRQ